MVRLPVEQRMIAIMVSWRYTNRTSA
ncbi:unnamed protein product, partial [Didymodactylos carnosus]